MAFCSLTDKVHVRREEDTNCFSSLLKNLKAMRRLLHSPETSKTANESRETADLCQIFFQPTLYLELHQTVTFYKKKSILLAGFALGFF